MGEGRAVGGEAQLLHLRNGGNPPADIQNPPADQRLPAGEADLADAAVHGGLGNFHQFLQRADVPAVPLGDASGGHAVPAAEGAEVRDGETQIGDVSGVAVPHGGLLSSLAA